MKTKTKIVVLVEIAIVLCSLFLVAIPAIAADQTTQKISATEVTTASEDDYVLDIYGNANEDDTIDMGDVVYTKLAIFGKKPKTELCDAKYDGRINVLDVIQTKLIILGKEKELTVVDHGDRIVTVKKPIKRVVLSMGMYTPTVMQILGVVEDKRIVGVYNYVKRHPKKFPELSKLPTFDYKDYEAILNLNPDLVVTWEGTYAIVAAEKLPGIPVVGIKAIMPHLISEGTMKFAYILDKEDEAKHFIDFKDKYLDLAKARTKGLSEEERPKVYEEMFGKPYTVLPQGLVEAAGGRDIFADVKGRTIDPEAVIEKNPDIIIKRVSFGESGYETDDLSKAKAVRDEIMSRPELANVNAVKNERIYGISGHLTYGPETFLTILYYAKWFYPELFEDLDPTAIHQEFVTEYVGLDFDVYEHGVWVYPPLE